MLITQTYHWKELQILKPMEKPSYLTPFGFGYGQKLWVQCEAKIDDVINNIIINNNKARKLRSAFRIRFKVIIGKIGKMLEAIKNLSHLSYQDRYLWRILVFWHFIVYYSFMYIKVLQLIRQTKRRQNYTPSRGL